MYSTAKVQKVIAGINARGGLFFSCAENEPGGEANTIDMIHGLDHSIVASARRVEILVRFMVDELNHPLDPIVDGSLYRT